MKQTNKIFVNSNNNLSLYKWYYINTNNYLKKKYIIGLEKIYLFNLFNILYIFFLCLSKCILKIKIINNEIIFYISNKKYLIIILTFFKYHFKLQFKEMVDICTIDFINNLQKNRFEINYNLLSLKYKQRIRLKIKIQEKEFIQSSVYLYSSSNWLERENWDMFGIFFIKHPDLRRILTDYGFEGFPFRKDFPLSGYIELRYDEEKKMVVYEKLELSQEFRLFEFTSPWNWSKI